MSANHRFPRQPNASARGSYAWWIVVLLMTAVSARAAPPAAPNVILIFADDLGYGSVSAYGGAIPTPNIDTLAVNGTRFTSGYMTAPVCKPSRNGIMTGRYQQRWGQELNSQTLPPVGASSGTLGVDHLTLGNAMKDAGYRNAAIGKWQLGMRKTLHPLDRGFDDFVGMAAGMNYLDPSWPGAHVLSPIGVLDDNHARRQNPDRLPGLFRGRERIPLESHLTRQLAQEGVAFIDRNKSRPFFLYLAFFAPHEPMQVMDEHYQRFPDIENETARIYAAMVSALDDAVGLLLAKLKQEGLEDRTLVVFTSDNGATAKHDPARTHNQPLIGHKRHLYEGGIRVPFLMQWKGQVPAGKVFTEPVSSLDLFPTFLAAAGLDDTGRYSLDGTNLLPYLTGKRAGTPHEYLFWRSGPNAAVRHGSWKLLMAGDLIRLYDVDKDPGESKDLAGQHPLVVQEMQKAWRDWAAEMAKGRRSPERRRTTTDYNGDHIEWHM